MIGVMHTAVGTGEHQLLSQGRWTERNTAYDHVEQFVFRGTNTFARFGRGRGLLPL